MALREGREDVLRNTLLCYALSDLATIDSWFKRLLRGQQININNSSCIDFAQKTNTFKPSITSEEDWGDFIDEFYGEPDDRELHEGVFESFLCRGEFGCYGVEYETGNQGQIETIASVTGIYVHGVFTTTPDEYGDDVDLGGTIQRLVREREVAALREKNTYGNFHMTEFKNLPSITQQGLLVRLGGTDNTGGISDLEGEGNYKDMSRQGVFFAPSLPEGTDLVKGKIAEFPPSAHKRYAILECTIPNRVTKQPDYSMFTDSLTMYYIEEDVPSEDIVAVWLYEEDITIPLSERSIQQAWKPPHRWPLETQSEKNAFWQHYEQVAKLDAQLRAQHPEWAA